MQWTVTSLSKQHPLHPVRVPTPHACANTMIIITKKIKSSLHGNNSNSIIHTKMPQTGRRYKGHTDTSGNNNLTLTIKNLDSLIDAIPASSLNPSRRFTEKRAIKYLHITNENLASSIVKLT